MPFSNKNLANDVKTHEECFRQPIPIIAATTLEVYERNIRLTASLATDSYSVTLPPAHECAGALFYFEASISGSKAVTLLEANGSTNALGDTFATDGDYCLIMSTGDDWIIVTNGISS